MEGVMTDNTPYCTKCGGCGEDGCCSALVCAKINMQDCDYGEDYYDDLKFAYLMFEDLFESHPDKKQRDEIFDRNWKKVYTRKK